MEIEKRVKEILCAALGYVAWEPNDAVTWAAYEEMANSGLMCIKEELGCTVLRAYCNEDTMSPEIVDRNALRVLVSCEFHGETAPRTLEFILGLKDLGSEFHALRRVLGECWSRRDE